MSDGAVYEGFVTVEQAGPQGMITLRGDLASAAMAQAVQAAVGLPVPGLRRIDSAGGRAVGWMSPDELLLLVPHAQVAAALDAVNRALAGEHFLAADVSDARAMFRIRGAQAHQVLAKLCPADLSPAAFGPGDLRRTRAAQVAAAVWLSGDEEMTLVCFRSVAGYVAGLLRASATPGSEIAAG